MAEVAVAAPAAAAPVASAPAAAAPADINPTVAPSGAAAAEMAAPAAAAPAAPAVETPSENIPWSANLSPELKEYVGANGKEWQNLDAVVNSYKNLEKLHGVPAERIIKLPDSPDSPEWKDVYKRLGTPDSPDGYGLEAADEADTSMVDWAKDAFHSLNLTESQGQSLVEKFNEYVNGQDNSSRETSAADAAKQEMSLKKDWGSAYDQNVANAQHAARRFGITADAIDALDQTMGHAETMKLMNKIGSKLGEAGFHNGLEGGGFGNIMTPEQAKSQINALKQDSAFTSKYLAGDVESKNKLSSLHKMAYPTD